MSSDDRFDALRAWLERALPAPMASIAPASSDASFRRYFRVTFAQKVYMSRVPGGAHSLIAMDAPPPQEDCRPFIEVAKLLAAAGVHAPAVLGEELSQGFLLLSDLGTRTYLAELSDANASALYRDATDALIRWQRASRDGVLPRYDRALLLRELNLFPDWYIAKHLGVVLDEKQRKVLLNAFERILDNNLAQPCVYVHRDYHSRNLMISEPNPGVLDFQDAVYGPVTYDLASLLRDAYVAWDEERQIDWAVRYWERARAARVPVGDDFGAFWRDFEWMGVQRQLKVLGIFARLWHRDGKAAFLQEMPRVMAYLRGACARYNALGPLLKLLDELEGRRATVGYTF
ncbi:MAG: phosphotransferase [Casimicrobiaceae bacterium]